jgi:DNA invertase Pin-like site-specific DNA recombinase
MSHKFFAYARVSTDEQNLDRQIAELSKHVADTRDIFCDKVSGKTFKRPQYQALKSILRKGDTLVIKELDRLGRDMDGIKTEWNELQQKGVAIVVLDNPILSTKGKTDLEAKLIGNIVFELYSYMAQKEREKIKQRQAEGIAAAKKKGKHLGRPKLTFDVKRFEKVYIKWKVGELKAVEAMEELGMTKASFYKQVKIFEENDEKDNRNRNS